MMIHVSHCPSLIISTWCGPLVLSFQVSPSLLLSPIEDIFILRNNMGYFNITVHWEEEGNDIDRIWSCHLLWPVIPLSGKVCYPISYNYQLYIKLLFLYRTVLTVFLFGIRGFATGFFQVIALYVPEVLSCYSTSTIMLLIWLFILGLPHLSESFWHIIVCSHWTHWINNCSICCPGIKCN